jgi:hypothetical protein
MKLNKVLRPLVGASLFAMSARAQVNVTITGSTAFRSITFDRVQSLFDAGYSTAGDVVGTGPGTFSGTMSNAIPSLHNTPVTVRLSFSGSGAGMLAVDQSTPVPTVNPGTGTTNNVVPDLALSDVFPESATPSINGAELEQAIVGVIPFVWVKNNALAGIANITREQAQLLCTSSGVVTNGVQLIPGMPASFLGGVSTNPVYMTGRDSGSGTRITVFADIGFTGTPREWGLSPGGVLVLTNGYSSGGNERAVIAGNTNVIGYLGVADAAAIAASASTISYEGVPFSVNNVQNGSYSMWGYEHLVNRTSGLSANQSAIRNALVAAITNQGYQTTNTLYTSSFVDQARMNVQRGTDGGTITSLNF